MRDAEIETILLSIDKDGGVLMGPIDNPSHIGTMRKRNRTRRNDHKYYFHGLRTDLLSSENQRKYLLAEANMGQFLAHLFTLEKGNALEKLQSVAGEGFARVVLDLQFEDFDFYPWELLPWGSGQPPLGASPKTSLVRRPYNEKQAEKAPSRPLSWLLSAPAGSLYNSVIKDIVDHLSSPRPLRTFPSIATRALPPQDVHTVKATPDVHVVVTHATGGSYMWDSSRSYLKPSAFGKKLLRFTGQTPLRIVLGCQHQGGFSTNGYGSSSIEELAVTLGDEVLIANSGAIYFPVIGPLLVYLAKHLFEGFPIDFALHEARKDMRAFEISEDRLNSHRSDVCGPSWPRFSCFSRYPEKLGTLDLGEGFTTDLDRLLSEISGRASDFLRKDHGGVQCSKYQQGLLETFKTKACSAPHGIDMNKEETTQ